VGWFAAVQAAGGGWTWQAAEGETPDGPIVTVRSPDDLRTVGAGFALGPDTVLTCAHVINDALGRGMLDSRPPGPDEIPVEVNTEDGTARCLARVAHWIPPRARDGGAVREGDGEWLGDLAVLRVDAPPGGLPVVPWRAAMADGQQVRAWHGSGRHASFADLTVTSLAGPIGYLDGHATGMAVGPGYSGGPLWCAAEKAVVGLVTAHFMPPRDPVTGAPLPHSPQHMTRRSWGFPWQHVEAELRALGVLDTVDPASVDPEDPAFVLLEEAICDALPSPSSRVEYAGRLARACGLAQGSDVTPPRPDEFTAFLLTHPRALATLSAFLRRRDPDATDRILDAGAFFPTPRLLSQQEITSLRRLLRKMERSVLGRFGEAVRAALPLAAALPGADTLDALLDRLEALSGDGRSATGERRVPALLCVMEHVGALCPGALRAELRMWSDGVAWRLGIPREQLGERRSMAQEWARGLRCRPMRPRVLVQVTRAEPGRYRLRIWCDEGAGPRQVSTDSVVSYSASEAAREVLRVLDSLTPPAEDERPPLVEVLVDRTSLNLPVDEWEARAPDEVVPGVLGVEFPLVVHCPELLRRHERFLPHWRKRWSRLDSGTTEVVSDSSADPGKIYAKLVNQLDTVRVSVDVSPGLRERVVQTCLAVGIPVVVWDRGQDGASHVVRHTAQVTTRELPDGVRSYRANAMASPSEFPGRPVLAWADADRTVPRLHLTEPQESA
jgi:hypothetical protein